MASIAPLLGPLAGASFILYFNWRVMFLVVAGFALLAWWGLWKYMPEPVGSVKNDGQTIAPVPLTFKVIAGNYKALLTNKRFMLNTWVAGLLSVPCIAWIALSPVIIVANAHQSVMVYALWQLPLFTTLILGNWALHRLTRHYNIEQMIALGTAITTSGLVLCWLLTYFLTPSFKLLIPGLMLYGFGLGIAGAPLSRLILFSTHVSKGTASALMSMLTMCVQAIGVEVGNFTYTARNDHFGLYCAIVGVVLLLSVLPIFFGNKKYTV